ncbi:MAG: hypoxanthine phosphoribosyltransferase [Bacteroidetes bacterium]|jgi:adenylate kinase|nr:hypoxanthine phosphoribosyltransferase [Bacteroidota bacterium]MCC6654949.1 hypoxanthine phosphoribosyltransferase [Flavobacteriales bacterium]HNK43057.1 phosphoribosyltransferase family protein [Flavobacteriales bacterium]
MTTVQLHDLRFEPFISEQELGRAIDVVAVGINAKYAGMRPLFIGVLNGSFFFASELLKRITIECEITFVKVASYHGTTSTGQVHQLIGLNERIHGRHVVVLEDIVDTGNTIEHLMGVLADHQPASVSVAALLFKPAAYKKDLPIEHVAMRIPNDFVVGSGLDHDGLGRNLPGILRLIKD